MEELKFTFKRYEERYAILENPLTGEIRWPIEHLPQECNPNDTVKLRLITQNQEEKENLLDLKKTLEELVN